MRGNRSRGETAPGSGRTGAPGQDRRRGAEAREEPQKRGQRRGGEGRASGEGITLNLDYSGKIALENGDGLE